MRRPVPTVPISPQQLKHFAAATVAITGLLAMFASGEGGGLSDDLQARAAQNKLAQTEVSKLGTTQLKAHVKLKNTDTHKTVIVPYHCRGIKKGLEQAILKQAGLK